MIDSQMLIAISGGIGSGKSVVCRILSSMGYDVYDCDSKAREIIDRDKHIKKKICDEICREAISDEGVVDRSKIAAAVFSDRSLLEKLNGIVHGAVRDDLAAWTKEHRSGSILFVETAILYQSGLDRMVDAVWEVEAPEGERIKRVCDRNGFTPDQVKARMDAQRYIPEHPHKRVFTIINDGNTSLLMQIYDGLRMNSSASLRNGNASR